METMISYNRSTELIAAEINDIKEQTKKQVLYNSIEIGRKLMEAKQLVDHGEWGKWLEEKVEYSKSTANNLMKIFKEYGTSQISLLEGNSKSQAIGNLNYTQAIALIGIKDPNERETFIENNDIDSMSTRELKKVIDEMNKIKKEKSIVENELNKYKAKSQNDEEKIKKIQKEKDEVLEELTQTSDKLLKELNGKESDILEAKREADNLKNKIKELEERPIDVITGVDENQIKEAEKNKKEIEELTKQRMEAEERIRILENTLNNSAKNNKNDIKLVEFKVHFEELVKCFKSILSDVSEINEDEQLKYREAVKGLIDKMLEKI